MFPRKYNDKYKYYYFASVTYLGIALNFRPFFRRWFIFLDYWNKSTLEIKRSNFVKILQADQN